VALPFLAEVIGATTLDAYFEHRVGVSSKGRKSASATGKTGNKRVSGVGCRVSGVEVRLEQREFQTGLSGFWGVGGRLGESMIPSMQSAGPLKRCAPVCVPGACPVPCSGVCPPSRMVPVRLPVCVPRCLWPVRSRCVSPVVAGAVRAPTCVPDVCPRCVSPGVRGPPVPGVCPHGVMPVRAPVCVPGACPVPVRVPPVCVAGPISVCPPVWGARQTLVCVPMATDARPCSGVCPRCLPSSDVCPPVCVSGPISVCVPRCAGPARFRCVSPGVRGPPVPGVCPPVSMARQCAGVRTCLCVREYRGARNE